MQVNVAEGKGKIDFANDYFFLSLSFFFFFLKVCIVGA